MSRFIHTSDWHLGMQAHFLPADARARYTQDRYDTVARIAELATREHCDFVVVAGDVFDSNHVSDGAIANACEALRAFTVPVYLLPGNHDCLNRSSVYRSRAWSERKPPLVQVLDTTEPQRPVAEVELVGAPITTKNGVGDPLAPAYAQTPPLQGTKRVIVGHGGVDYLNPGGGEPDEISSRAVAEAIANGTAAYVALGDRHSTTEISATSGHAYYSGTPMVTRYDEAQAGEVLIVTLDDDGSRAEPRQVGEWSFVNIPADLHGSADVASLSSRLQATPHKARTAIKLSLRGTLSLADSASLDAVLAESEDLFASINRWQSHSDLAVEPTQEDLSKLEVSGYVRDSLQHLRELATVDGGQAQSARDALNLLYRLAR